MDMTGKRVCVLVDNPWVLQSLSNLFARAGAEVHGCNDMDHRCAQVCPYQPNLVVVDLALTDIDGSGICARIQAVCGAPVIVLSPLAWESVCSGERAGSVDWLLKPFHPKALLCRAGERMGVPQPDGSTRTA